MFEKTHQPCPECGSSDGLGENPDGSTKCFACGDFKPSQRLNNPQATQASPKPKKPAVGPSDGFYDGFSDRGLTRSTAEAYKVQKTHSGDVFFPYHNADGEVVAYKVRDAEKNFKSTGSIGDGLLFGQNKFTKGGKFVTIVEGEFDALAAFQMLGSKYPVVSIKNGAQSALNDCKKQFEWLDSFESVVICFDADEPGRKATQQVSELFGAKAKIFPITEGYKDACDYSGKKQSALFVDKWWKSEQFKPEGVVTVKDIKERLLTPPEPGVNWCFPTLTRLTYGRRKGELYAFGAGVGVGKTDVFTQQIAYDIDVLNLRVGVIYLEQNVVETAQRVMGKLDKRLYHVPDAAWTQFEYEQSVDRLEDRDQLYMFEHFGAMDWKTIKSIIRFFNKAYDINHIYLDHLTALSANEQDERRALDGIMADMASLAQELGIVIHFISHLTTPDGKPHEEGGRVMEKHFTGSRAIARWSHYMFGLERNKQDEDPVKRQTTTFRVLKDRYTGSATGMKFGIFYDRSTGILEETTLPEDEPL